ncbi:MAG: FAD-binding protein [Phycisphaerales bacterium]|nr:FAD-binding protein [Phycisphaerales bacterium]
MEKIEVVNWFGDLKTYPAVIADVYSVEDMIKIIEDPIKYPSPIKAVGQNHSTAQCCEADGGTIAKIKMNKILEIGEDTITVEPGVLYKDIAEALDKVNKQLYINTEIGCLTAGSAACAATKDSSFPNEWGQVGSYITAIHLLTPTGDKIIVDESKPDLLKALRSSYGNFGFIYQVTFKTRKKKRLKVWHQSWHVNDFIENLELIKQTPAALMYYLYPFENKIAVEYRAYVDEKDYDHAEQVNTSLWKIRNHLWKQTAPYLGQWVEQYAPRFLRYRLVDGFNAVVRLGMTNFLKSDNTNPADQILRYPDVSDKHRYTFSLWAFPERKYPIILPSYYRFCQEYYKKNGYRTNLLNVGYRIAQDANSLFSYSYHESVMTVDPVSTGNAGWRDFLVAYNNFCSNLDGTPMFNQTWGVTKEQAEKAFGERLEIFKKMRKQLDPQNRFLNHYFAAVLNEQ